MEKESFEIDFLTNKEHLYLTSGSKVKYAVCEQLELQDLALYHMEEVSFEDKAPRKEALENVLSTMKIDGINFIYLIMGDEDGVHFYYGIARNYAENSGNDLSIYDMGKEILEPSVKGNFRGSKISEVEAAKKREIMGVISDMKYYSMLEGVPGSTKEDEKFQGVDRLADVMMGDRFGFMIIASPVSYDDIKEIEKNLYEVYSRIVPFAKKSRQSGTSLNTSKSKGTTTGTSETVGESRSKTKQDSVTVTDGKNEGTNKGISFTKTVGTSQGTSSSETSNGSSHSSTKESNKGGSESEADGRNEGSSKGTSHSEGKTTGGSETEGTSTSKGTNKSVSEQDSTGKGTSDSTTLEYVDKKSQDWIKYFDDVIMPRLDYGMGKGIFITTSFLFSDSKAVLKKLENTAISLYSGETGNKVPLRAAALTKKDRKLGFLKNFQLPMGCFEKKISEHEPISRSALSQYVRQDRTFAVGNWITTNELAMVAGLPQKEVVGLALKEEVEFGLNYDSKMPKEDKIKLGKLVQSGNVLSNKTVCLNRQNLDKHIFVTGVTGSGKTTTCQNILYDSRIPFLVIEPAKTEYRILIDKYEDLMVFTLGNDKGTPFRLNPFEFFPHENITSRVDMIRASIEAAFDMEAAIPQLIESAIYACYEDYGWNIALNENETYKNPFADGVYAFPTLEDLVVKIDSVVAKQGFDDRLKNDYIGSIKARLQGLLMGAKGLMLNTKRSIDFRELLDRRVVLEFEEIRSGAEKSLIMGFVLTNLMEAIKAKFFERGAYSHITLVEEAHRLLSKYMPGDSPNKKHGVETFTDMLAEIRKYGESLIIVDQIPNKLTPEILKNTNTKIVHRLFAEDDKEAIGNTIVLDNEQKGFLSNLETGRAIVFTQGFEKALQIQINSATDTTSDRQVHNEELKGEVYRYYARNYKKGIIPELCYFDHMPKEEMTERILDVSRNYYLSLLVSNYREKYGNMPTIKVLDDLKEMQRNEELREFGRNLNKSPKSDEEVRKPNRIEFIKKYENKYGYDYLAKYLAALYYIGKGEKPKASRAFDSGQQGKISEFLKRYVENENFTREEYKCFKQSL